MSSHQFTGTNTSSSAPRVDFLDGLRGLAAFYVMLFHAWGELAWSADYSHFMDSFYRFWKPLTYGHYSVVFFIAVSGYSLMIPILRQEKNRLEGGFKTFLLRRVLRIVPAYYCSLALALAVIFLVPGMNQFSGVRWDSFIPVTAGAFWSHIFLVQNLSYDWIYRINNPCWSLSTEWEIYFVFALILLPVWRRFGSVTTLVASLVLSMAAFYLSGKGLRYACPWFLTVFSIGMLAAELRFSRDRKKTDRQALPFGWIGALLLCLCLGLIEFNIAQLGPVIDILSGASFTCLLVVLARPHQTTLTIRMRSALNSGPIKFLGAISYSLYLIHAVVFGVFHRFLVFIKATPETAIWSIFGIGVPMAIGVAWVMYLCFEKPYFTWRQRGKAAEPMRPKESQSQRELVQV